MPSENNKNRSYLEDSTANSGLLFPFSKKQPMSDMRKKQPLKVEQEPELPAPIVLETISETTEEHPIAELFIASPAVHEALPEKPTQEEPVAIPAQAASSLNPFRNPKVRSQVVVYAMILIIAGVGLHLGEVAVRASKVKTAVLGATSAGLAALGQGQSLVLNKQFSDSEHSFDLAQSYFLQGKVDLQSEGQLTAALIAATPQGQDANRILDAGKNISAAGSSLAKLSAESKNISISAAGFSSPSGLHATLNSIDAEAVDAQHHLQTAQSDLSAVQLSSVPQNYQSQFTAASSQITTYIQTLAEMRSLIALANSFFSQGPQTILVLFENNNELRPGGGFIGTYGIYHLQNGAVTYQKISSIYDLDGQLLGKKKIAPPGEFAQLTDSWALRDSNWFPDFRMDAAKASSFYELEGQETPDAVIAITPDVFEDVLKITGPIAFPKYNVTLSADNFRDIVQLDTSDKTSSTPKQMLADFAPLVLQKISTLPRGGNTAIANALLTNLQRKNILAYSRNSDVESQLVSANWAGSLAITDKDYLAVSAANLGGQKTDLHIKQSLQLQSQVQADNSIVDTITYTRTHNDIASDPNNSSYVRFVVPQGSKLISATGFSRRLYYKADGSAYASFEGLQGFSVDADLAKIDASTQVDSSSGVVSDVEGDKTTLGNWMITAPGQSQTVTVSYKLPFSFDTKSQSLIVQKQPGATDIDFSYQFGAATGSTRLPNVLWYTPNIATTNNNTYSVKSTINADQIFGAVFGQ